MSRTAPLLVLACLAFIPSPLRSQTLPAAAQQTYDQGIEAEQNDQLDVALDRFQSALKQSPQSPLCYEAIVRVQSTMGNDKAALATVAQMIAAAPDAHARSHAEMLQANIYYQQYSAYTTGGGAYEKDPKRADAALRKSETALEAALADDSTDESLRMLHAHVLAALHRDEDASREFTACAAIPGTSPTECSRALKLAHSAELGRLEPAPSFKATTLDGQTVSLDSLAGKAVLIDFWGSWCHFCVRDSDYVQSMLDSFDPKSFVLLEVNEGDSPETWRHYVEDKRLHGVQVQDTSRQLQSLFHVSGFPTYILLDSDGLIHQRFSGAVGDLRGGIRKILEAQPSSTPATASVPGN